MVETTMQETIDGDVTALARYGLKTPEITGFGKAPADDRPVIFHDMRKVADAPQLFREGFELIPHKSAVSDFESAEAIADIYLDEVRELLCARLGTPHVFMQQNWVLRAETRDNSARPLPGGRNAMTMKTGGFVHLDYDEEAARFWARYSLDKLGVAEEPKGRLLVITAWRAISSPPQDKPLALVDRRSVSTDQYILEHIQTPLLEWNGYQISHDEQHRFCWWSGMQPDELILFLQHQDGYGPGSGAPHTAFNHPNCAMDVPPRHSLEVRAYAYLPD